MAARKAAGKKRSGSAARRGSGGARKRLTPGSKARGLASSEMPLSLEDASVRALVLEVERLGGKALAAYRDPFAGRPLVLAALPRETIEPTPFQRDLSPTHAKRLAQKIEESGSYLDPIIAVRGADGRLWSPNGRHRLAAAKVLGQRSITALVSPDEDLAFRILALNTEKAHNLKDQALEVIRMARELAARDPKAKESQYAAEFEAPELLTLGIVYSANPRFSGGVYRPLLKKVERFADRPLSKSLETRAGYAARLGEIHADVERIVAGLKQRGFQSPYVKSYVVARLNPVRFAKVSKGDSKPPMELGAALTRMAAAARKFDLDSVRAGDLALVAAVASDEE